MLVDIHTHGLTISHKEGTPALVRYFDLFQLFLGGRRFHRQWLHKSDGRRLGCQPFGPVCTLLFPSNRHSLPPECMFPALLDLPNPFDRLDRSMHQLAIVADRDISALLEIDCSINGHLLASCFAECLRPPYLARVAFHFEVLVTFGGTKTKDFGIVANKRRSVAWVDVRRAEITLFDTHASMGGRGLAVGIDYN